MSIFWTRRVAEPALALLREGVTPEKIALVVALGITLGVTPIIGSTTLLCMAAASLLRLNPAAIQIVNCLMLPIQLMLIVPFIRVGEWIFGAARNPVTLERMRHLIQENVWNAMATLWTATVHALVAWALVGAIVIFPLYRLMLVPLRRLEHWREDIP